jgi:hypothetical protein
MLLVHHGDAEIAEGDALLEQGVRPDGDLDPAVREACQNRAPRRALLAPR